MENYFLGILPEALRDDEQPRDSKDLENVSVQLQIGEDLAEEYDNWEEANVLFDNDVITQLDNTSVPLADYYNAKLIIGNEKIEVDLVWVDQKLLITSGEEDDILSDMAKQSGWTCIPMADISTDLLEAYF